MAHKGLLINNLDTYVNDQWILTLLWALTTRARRRGASPAAGSRAGKRPARTPAAATTRELMEAIIVVAIGVYVHGLK